MTHDLSTREGLAAYLATSAPTVDAYSAAIHLDIEPGHIIDGHEISRAIWSRCSYFADYVPHVGLHYHDADGEHGTVTTPDPLPSWVPRPPASWLTITDELRTAVGS